MVNAKHFYFIVNLLLLFSFTAFAQEGDSRLRKLTKQADVILTGKVTQKQSGWNAGKTRIYTKTTLQVDEYLKGKNDGNSVEISYPGGEVGQVGELYTHMPRFRDKEEVLVFLKRDKKNKGFTVLDGEEGKITLLKDADTKEKENRTHSPVKTIKAQIRSFLNEK